MPRILVVDDEPIGRQLTTQVLEDAGYNVSQASTAREAVDRCKTGAFDLVLLDLILPDRTGIELLGELKALRPQLQVIIVTAYPEIRSSVEAMRRGAADYLVKPVDAEALLETCGTALARAKVLPATPVAAGGSHPCQTPAWAPVGLPRPLREVVDAYIDHVVAVTHGNKARAARILRISRETLRAKLANRRAPGAP